MSSQQEERLAESLARDLSSCRRKVWSGGTPIPLPDGGCLVGFTIEKAGRADVASLRDCRQELADLLVAARRVGIAKHFKKVLFHCRLCPPEPPPVVWLTVEIHSARLEEVPTGLTGDDLERYCENVLCRAPKIQAEWERTRGFVGGRAAQESAAGPEAEKTDEDDAAGDPERDD